MVKHCSELPVLVRPGQAAPQLLIQPQAVQSPAPATMVAMTAISSQQNMVAKLPLPPQKAQTPPQVNQGPRILHGMWICF